MGVGLDWEAKLPQAVPLLVDVGDGAKLLGLDLESCWRLIRVWRVKKRG